jgi:hypothetical protein
MIKIKHYYVENLHLVCGQECCKEYGSVVIVEVMQGTELSKIPQVAEHLPELSVIPEVNS